MFDQKDSPFYPVVAVDEETGEALDAMESGAETKEEAEDVAERDGWYPTGPARLHDEDGFWYIDVPSPSGLITRITQGQTVPPRKLSFLLLLLHRYDSAAAYDTEDGPRILLYDVEMTVGEADSFMYHLRNFTIQQLGDGEALDIVESVCTHIARAHFTIAAVPHPIPTANDYFSAVSYT